MSRNSQPGVQRSGPLRFDIPASFGAVAVGSFEMSFGQRFPPHQHAEHQLAWSEHGALAVTVLERTWVLPPTRALFIPGGLVHSVQAASPATMRSVYFRKNRAPVRWSKPTAVAMSPLLRELVCFLAPNDRDAQGHKEARVLLGALLAPLETDWLDVPLPRDARARRVAELLLKRAADPRTLARLGKEAGASARTLARLWTSETEMSFGQWRTQLRIRCALAYLSEGRAVSEVAGLVGYESTSAFVAAFRRRIGVPPGSYFTTPARPSDSKGPM